LYQELLHVLGRRNRGLRNKSRGIITGRISIKYRLAIVKSWKLIGEIEGDFMMGKNAVSQSIRRILHKSMYPLRTQTFDNDKAFAEHQAIGLALGLETYFTKPYSQDKGTVENRIGQIRRFLPK